MHENNQGDQQYKVDRLLYFACQNLTDMDPHVFASEVVVGWHRHTRFILRYIGKEFDPNSLTSEGVTFKEYDAHNQVVTYAFTYPEIAYFFSQIPKTIQKAVSPTPNSKNLKTECIREYIELLKLVNQFNQENESYKQQWINGKWKHIAAGLKAK